MADIHNIIGRLDRHEALLLEIRDSIMAGAHQARQPAAGDPWAEGDILCTKQAAVLLHLSADSSVYRRAAGQPWARQFGKGATWQFSSILMMEMLTDAHNTQDRCG